MRERRWAVVMGRVAGCSIVGPLLAVGSVAVSGSTAAATVPRSHAVIEVVAAENFWGSIASEIGGRRVAVNSIITNPNIDPHSYEPTARDARSLAGANLVIENGIGYDPWVPKLLAADLTHPVVVDVGTVLGVPNGGNPHRWYDPTDVRTVTGKIVADLQKLDPADRAYFVRQQQQFYAVDLKQYDATIAAIKAKYAGTKVGASESIFAMLAPSLGLNLITPASFLRAISEGTDPTAADKSTIDKQISRHTIKVYIYNSQNVTPDVQAQLAEVRAAHIPTVTITETLAPANSTFQAWQTKQLLAIESALAAARSGR